MVLWIIYSFLIRLLCFIYCIRYVCLRERSHFSESPDTYQLIGKSEKLIKGKHDEKCGTYTPWILHSLNLSVSLSTWFQGMCPLIGVLSSPSYINYTHTTFRYLLDLATLRWRELHKLMKIKILAYFLWFLFLVVWFGSLSLVFNIVFSTAITPFTPIFHLFFTIIKWSNYNKKSTA